MTKYRVVTANAIFGAGGESLQIGNEIEVDSLPDGWKTFVTAVSSTPKGTELIVNPAQDDDKPARRGRPKGNE